MKILDALRGWLRPQEISRYTLSDYIQWVMQYGAPQDPLGYRTTYGNLPAEPIGDSFVEYVSNAYRSNGIVYACEMVRCKVFSEARFQFQALRKGRPSELFGDQSLSVLERPWMGGTTGDMLMRMILDADLAGNWFGVILEDEVVRLRPDWVDIILAPRYGPGGGIVGMKRVGYAYYEGGKNNPGGVYGEPSTEPEVFLANEVAHFAPSPDPLANYRGMSWLTPVVREVQADTQATRHKLKWFENAAPQPLDAKILTPRGWSTMGSMVVGSEVIGSDGKPHRVTGVYPQGEQDIHRVVFHDGSTVECTEDHLWAVQNAYDRARGVNRVLSLREIVERGIHYPSGPAKWAVPFADPVEFDDAGPLPVHPYLLGLLLGDGCFRASNGKDSGTVSLAADLQDADWLETRLPDLVPPDVQVRRRDRLGQRGSCAEFSFPRVKGTDRGNALAAALRQVGLWGLLGPEKFVPEAYLRASATDRLAVLQGLIDSDGWVSAAQPNLVRFTNRSRALALAVDELTRSLGGTATVVPVPTKRQWSVLVQRLPEGITPCRMPRKATRYAPPSQRAQRKRTIVAVEHVGRKQAQCIRVDVPDSLYITDGYVPTHNTPNLAVSLPKEVTPEQFEEFVDKMDAKHKGTENAYKTLYTGGGADVTVVGKDMRQMDFKVTQGAGETRIAAAAGVHPVVAALSEGMQGSSLNSGNFQAAKRAVGQITFRPLWRNAAGSLEVLVPPPDPDTSRLWYDARDVDFLREDEKDAAEIRFKDAQTIRTLSDAGAQWDAAVEFVDSGEVTRLRGRHSGLFSVQLQPPMSTTPAPVTVTDAARAQQMIAAGWQVIHVGPSRELQAIANGSSGG